MSKHIGTVSINGVPFLSYMQHRQILSPSTMPHEVVDALAAAICDGAPMGIGHNPADRTTVIVEPHLYEQRAALTLRPMYKRADGVWGLAPVPDVDVQWIGTSDHRENF